MALKQWEKIELSDSSSETLNIIKTQYYYVPDNCKAGYTVILDGIECLCVATGVTIQGSTLTRIAIDKNHDLGYYQKYVGMTINGTVISQINSWRWGGYGTAIDNISVGVGYGLQNTINCLANSVNYTKGTYTGTKGDGYPWLWQGVNDFRASHSDKWFVPSRDDLYDYVRKYTSSLSFDSDTGGLSTSYYWSSSQATPNNTTSSIGVKLSGSSPISDGSKYYFSSVRLCRAF